MHYAKYLMFLVVALSLSACSLGGELEAGDDPGLNGSDDGSEESPIDPDQPIEPGVYSLTGIAKSWTPGNQLPIPAAKASVLGMTPAMDALASPEGSFVFGDLDDLTTLQLELSVPVGYRTTVNPMMQINGGPLVRDVYALSDLEALANYDAAGVIPQVNTSILIGEFLKGDGTPRDGVLKDDILLLDVDGNPVEAIPYFIGADGVIDPAILQSEIHNGMALVMFLNVTAGQYTLQATYPKDGDAGNGGGGGGGGGVPNLKTAAIEGLVNGASIVRVNDKLVPSI